MNWSNCILYEYFNELTELGSKKSVEIRLPKQLKTIRKDKNETNRRRNVSRVNRSLR